MLGCVNDSQHVKSISYKSIDDLIGKIETICLDFQAKDIVLSLKIRNDTLKNDYNFRYLGMLKVKEKKFDVVEKYIFSGQELDSQRANGSIMLFSNKKLYGEYIGLDNNYIVNISSHKIKVFNKKQRILPNLKYRIRFQLNYSFLIVVLTLFSKVIFYI